jgi:hypothetical protein
MNIVPNGYKNTLRKVSGTAHVIKSYKIVKFKQLLQQLYYYLIYL